MSFHRPSRHGTIRLSAVFDQCPDGLLHFHTGNEADPPTRRLFNQAFFQRIFICDNGTVTHEFAEPFKILPDPGLPGRLAVLGNRNRTVVEKETDHPELPRAAGSNVDILVVLSGQLLNLRDEAKRLC